MAKKEHPSHIWTGVIVGACLLTVVSIFLLKRASDRRSPVYTQLHPEDTVAVKERMPVACPDTTIDATYLPILRDTVNVALSDSITRDTRGAYEAGSEDGYLAGMDDGATQHPHASYDTSNAFTKPKDKAAYVRGYGEGYQKGFEDGAKGKQFNIGN